jgi:hypothetical protein
LLELVALIPAHPLLRRAPRGDGHPVLVLPGLMASDFSTRALRGFLRAGATGSTVLTPQHAPARSTPGSLPRARSHG